MFPDLHSYIVKIQAILSFFLLKSLFLKVLQMSPFLPYWPLLAHTYPEKIVNFWRKPIKALQTCLPELVALRAVKTWYPSPSSWQKLLKEERIPGFVSGGVDNRRWAFLWPGRGGVRGGEGGSNPCLPGLQSFFLTTRSTPVPVLNVKEVRWCSGHSSLAFGVFRKVMFCYFKDDESLWSVQQRLTKQKFLPGEKALTGWRNPGAGYTQSNFTSFMQLDSKGNEINLLKIFFKN